MSGAQKWKHPPLLYDHTPLPRWIGRMRRARLLTPAEADLLNTLFDLASTTQLAIRGETPTLSLERLLDSLCLRPPRGLNNHRLAIQALTRRLRRARAKGLLGFRVIGNTITGYKYVFLLYPDGPVGSSVHRPGSTSSPRPTSPSLEYELVSDVSPVDTARASATDYTEVETGSPASDIARPTSEVARTTHGERDRAAAPSVEGPTALDLQDNNKILLRGRDADESLNEASIVDAGVSARDATTDPSEAWREPFERARRAGGAAPFVIGEEGFGSFSRGEYRAGKISRERHLANLELHGRALRRQARSGDNPSESDRDSGAEGPTP